MIAISGALLVGRLVDLVLAHSFNAPLSREQILDALEEIARLDHERAEVKP